MNAQTAFAGETANGHALSDREFNRLRELVREHTGISLSEAKCQLVCGRLVRRLRTLRLRGPGDYIALLEQRDPVELAEFINAITTNLTSFFREGHHFEYLANTALPQAVSRNAATRRIRIWSCACSTGEEPYSTAIVLREQHSLLAGYDVRILATDLDSTALATAAAGVYGADLLQTVPKACSAKYFCNGVGANAGKYRVDESLRELIAFKQLNLMQEWPMRGPFDIIFCRNVIIYFDQDTQRKLFERMSALQRPGDILFLGHSESLNRVSELYEPVGRSIYRRMVG